MSDPLSIAASVAGLLATAGTICTTLSSFIDAPESARAALAAVEEVRLALEMVKQLVDTVSALSSRRRALVRLDHIAITFSNCIRTLSELESLVCFKDNIMHRLRWVWGEKKVLQLLPRLESQKSSLLLMVTVLRCQSEIEALQGRDRLNAAIDQILQRDEKFAARLLSDPAFEIEDRSVRFHDGESTVQSLRMSRKASFGPGGFSSSSLPTSQPPSSGPETSLSESCASSVSRRDFEITLEESRVYTRTGSNDSDMSFTSSAIRSHAWSMLSLNDISIVAVFRLPITLADIECFGPGLTFAALLKGEAPQVATSQQEVTTLLIGPNSQQDTTSLTPTEANPKDTTSQTAANHAESQNTQVTAFNPKTSAPIRGGNRTPEEKAAEDPRYVNNKRVVATIKVVVVGDRNTAKNTTLISYTTGKFPTEYTPTVFSGHAVAVLIGKDPYLLELHDTTGTEDYDRLRPLDYVETDVFLVFARVGLPQSYESIEKKWVPEIQHHRPRTPFIMVGINCPDEDGDLPHGEITGVSDYKALGEAMARRVGAVKYLECDILSQLRLKDVFDEAIVAALEPPRQKRKRLRRSWRPKFLDAVKETNEEESSH